MQITVFGATGGVGQACVRLALAAGHDVVAAARTTSLARVPDGARRCACDVMDLASVATAIRGSDAVISCLGMRRRWPRNPWSALLSPRDLSSTSARHIATACAAAGITRGAAVSAAGVAGSSMNWLMRRLVSCSNIGPMYADLARMEATYAELAPTFAVVRPVTLTNGRMRPGRPVAHYGVFDTISRAAVAQILLDAALLAAAPWHLRMIAA